MDATCHSLSLNWSGCEISYQSESFCIAILYLLILRVPCDNLYVRMGIQVQGTIQHGEGDVVSHDWVPQVGDQTMGGCCSEHEAKAERAICLDGRKSDKARSCFVEGNRALDGRPWRLALELNIHQVDLV